MHNGSVLKLVLSIFNFVPITNYNNTLNFLFNIKAYHWVIKGNFNILCPIINKLPINYIIIFQNKYIYELSYF